MSDTTLVLCAHKCRGEATMELALRWDFGTPSDPAPWYILQSTGNRIYPYWVEDVKIAIRDFMDIPPPPPADHRDFYDIRTEKKNLSTSPSVGHPTHRKLRRMEDFI